MNALGESLCASDRNPVRASCAETNKPVPMLDDLTKSGNGSDRGSEATFGGK